jgi:hypothetical protein
MEECQHAAQYREHEAHGLRRVTVVYFPLHGPEEILLSQRAEVLGSKVRDQVDIDTVMGIRL